MTPSRLHGRTEELARLRALWDAATVRDASGRFVGGPRMAVVVAETGYGKTRLVQALYQQLTTDPAWDPDEINYWPDAFQAPGEQLRVNPDPEGHEPKGPPQFMWLGMRWQPTEERNVEERTCAIPAARDALQAHVRIADRMRPAWQHARANLERTLRAGGAANTLARAADLAVPFGELGVRFLKGAVDLARDRGNARRAAGAEADRQASDAAEEFVAEMREVFGGAGSAGRVLPTILWLDDAQWIDAVTLRFVHELWEQARERRWPLLVVVTHWEREWAELRAAGTEGSLASLEGTPGVERIHLGPSTRADLDAFLSDRLPGLTPPQRDLLLDKSGGNFLTMVENVGELLANPEAFVGGSVGRALSADGERFVQEWESNRQRRIEQRFGRLASEVRTVLGWGSALGIRFLKDVIADHAVRTGLAKDPGLLIDACVTPFAILGSPSPNVREFRDRAFHVVARKHFERWGSGHADSLRATLREHLVRWVNASFDDEGAILRPDEDEPSWAPPQGAAIFLAPEERRDLLGMAVRELELPDAPDWKDPAHAAALRARILLAWTDEFERLFDRVRQTALTMVAVDWSRVPRRVIDLGDRYIAATDWKEAGALRAARPLLGSLMKAVRRDSGEDPGEGADSLLSMVLAEMAEVDSELGDKHGALRMLEELVSVERRRVDRGESEDAEAALAFALLLLADVRMSLDDVQGSREASEESLRIRESSLGDPPSADELRSVSVALDHLGHLDKIEGDDGAAERRYRRSLEIARSVVAEEPSIQARRDLAISLMNVADTVERSKGHDESLILLQEALEISRGLAAEDGDPDLQADLAHALQQVGDAEAHLRRFDDAWAHLGESLELSQALNEASPRPSLRRSVSITLSSMVNVARARGEHEDALRLAREAVELDREALADLRTSKTLRDLAVGLTSVAELEDHLGEEGALDHALEALELRKEVIALADRPLHRADLWMAYRLATALQAEGRDEAVLDLAEEWLQFHQSMPADESGELPPGPLASLTAYAALIELTRRDPDDGLRRAKAALALAGPRDPAKDDPTTLLFTARLLASAIVVVHMRENGAGWPEARPYLKDALELANLCNARLDDEDAGSPDWWDAVGCCLAYKAAEDYFRHRGDAASAERAARRTAQWESLAEDA
jgi:tetratricopeptide (TPR) repeat protein